MLIGISKFFKDNKVALVSCYMKNALVFSQSDRVIFSCILIHAGRVWNFGSSYRRIHTDPASSNKIGKWEVCRHAKRQKWKRKNTRPRLAFPRRFFCAAAASHCFTTEQSFEASLFVNATHLILKGGDSRLKLLSFEIFVVLGQIEANFHYFASYLHSAVVLRNETHQMMK